MSVNKVILIGHLGKDPEVKFSASGRALCRFSVATNETFKDKNGEQQQRTEWHSVVCFGKLAEVCGEHLTRGKAVYLEGSIRSGQWEDKEGNRRKSVDIIVRQMQMLSPVTNGKGAKSRNMPAAKPVPADENDNPFREDQAASEDVPF